MPIFTVTITGVSPDPEVYGGLTAAANYVGATFGGAATAWLDLSTSQKGQTLVMATRYIDQQTWDGDATGLVGVDATTLQFPRTGLTRDGEDVDSTLVPPEVERATFELALLIAGDPGVVSKVDQGSNISSVSGGGGVSVSFFSPSSVVQGTATKMPVVVQRLLARFLATPAGASEGGFSQAGNCQSQFSACKQFNLVRPE